MSIKMIKCFFATFNLANVLPDLIGDMRLIESKMQIGPGASQIVSVESASTSSPHRCDSAENTSVTPRVGFGSVRKLHIFKFISVKAYKRKFVVRKVLLPRL